MPPSEASRHRTDAKRGPKKRVAPGVYLRAGKYLVTYADVDGRERSKTTDARNLTEAKAAREAIRVKVRSGEAVAPNRVTLDEVAQEFFALFDSLVAAGERSERTAELYRQRYDCYVKPRIGRVQIQALRAEHVSRLLAEMRHAGTAARVGRKRAATAPWTLKGVLVVLSSILSHAMTRGLIVESPLKRLSKTETPKGKSEREHRRLTDEECQALIAATTPTYRPLIATAVFTGMRLSEVLGLRWQDVDFEEGVIRVRHQLSVAKVDKPARVVPLKTPRAKRGIDMLSGLTEMLKAHKAAALRFGWHGPQSYVFVTGNGTPHHQRNVSRALSKAADAAGLNGDGMEALEMHDLRRTAISRWIAAGLDVVTVSRMAGHSRPSVTLDIYADEFEKAKRGAEIRARLEAGTSINLNEVV